MFYISGQNCRVSAFVLRLPARVAQSLARLTHEPEVPGSIGWLVVLGLTAL